MSRSHLVAEGLEPAWDVARLFPPQGSWSEEEFFRLPGNHLVEFDHGRIEVLALPSQLHQLVVAYLYRTLLEPVVAGGLGTVLFAPFPIKLWDGKVREPDVCFMAREHDRRRRDSHWDGADLVIEVLSPDDPRRDREVKRREYAQAGIPEYWLVDPNAPSVTVFALDPTRREYRTAAFAERGQAVRSSVVPGFAVDVDAMLAAARLEDLDRDSGR